MTRKRPAPLPCGCRPGDKYCPQHWSLLTPQQRREHLAALPVERVWRTR